VAAALFERITSVDAETTLRKTVDRPRTFDRAHLQDIHRRLFADVYDWAGQLRYIDLSKPDETGEPFLHHRSITLYTSAVVDPLQAEANLARQSDPGIWADSAAHSGRRCCTPTPSAKATAAASESGSKISPMPAGTIFGGSAAAPTATCSSQMRALFTRGAGGTRTRDRRTISRAVRGYSPIYGLLCLRLRHRDGPPATRVAFSSRHV
jgi:hypothetical protein